MIQRPSARLPTGAVFLAVLCFLLPLAHPLLLPYVGVASHLLWWIHVLPVAFITYHLGTRGAAASVGFSTIWILVGERTFGAGYWIPADWETTLSLTAALLFTHALVVAFALYARRITLRHRLLLEEISLGVLRTDGRGRVVDANPAARSTLAAELPELRRWRVQEHLVHPPLEDMEALVETGGWSGRVHLSSGQEEEDRALSLFVAAMRHPDTDGYHVIVADRSLEVLREAELRRTSKLATLGEGLAAVAHELKNPLAVISAHAELELESPAEPLHEETREALETIRTQSERMDAFLKDLLAFSRSGNQELEQEEEDEKCTAIHALVEELVGVQRFTLGRNVTLDSTVDWEGAVRTSARKVEQILINLVSNARDAIGEDGGEIRVHVRRRDDLVELEVMDDGPGIDDELLPRIFDPYVTGKGDEGGTGLGLAICRRLARSMGGDLSARNREEGGASFLLTLPPSPPPCPRGEGQGHPGQNEAATQQGLPGGGLGDGGEEPGDEGGSHRLSKDGQVRHVGA